MSNEILVFAEHRDGAFNKTSFEAMAAAQELGAALGQSVLRILGIFPIFYLSAPS